MPQKSYSFFYDGDEFADLSIPLRVNSAGYCSLSVPFVQSRRRRDSYLQLIDTGELYDHVLGQTITPGQMILRDADTVQRYELLPGGSIGYFWLHFTGREAAALKASARIESGVIHTLTAEGRERALGIFHKLFREFMLRRIGWESITASLLTQLLVGIGRDLHRFDDSPDAGLLRRRLEKSAGCIHAGYAHDIRIAELAQMEHLSESRYRELFREAFGMPPGDYILNLRIGCAKDLLQTTDLPVGEIARMCGYGDALYFCRLFKKKTGMTAGAFRRQMPGTDQS